MTNGRVSFTHTALIWTGIILCLIGAGVAILGLGGLTALEVSYNSATVKTTSIGLAILVIGALLSGIVALRLPPDVIVLAEENKYTLTEKLARKIPFLSLMICLAGILFLVLSFLNRW